jgi:hypothetical protein
MKNAMMMIHGAMAIISMTRKFSSQKKQSLNSIMASIGEVYGQDFQEKAVYDKAEYVAKLYASNIAHKQFSFHNEGSAMWIKNNMKPEIINALIKQVAMNNQKFRMVHIVKTSPNINMFPYLINGAVEYFVVVDLTGKKIALYSIYITPTQMEAY